VAAPGDQISIFGANLGPTDGVRAAVGQNLPTTLGQTTVTFDGVPAPIYYVSDKFVAVQAPTNLSVGSNSRVQVNATSGTSGAVPITIASANPGLYTYEAGGSGQAKALNQDGSPNGDGSILGTDKPAPPGSVISVYATGLGPVSPAVSQGTPAPSSPLSVTSLPVTATIAGRSATVTFAGLAPGTVGAYQVNILVPPSTPSGTARLTLSVDGNVSQNAVTVEIK